MSDNKTNKFSAAPSLTGYLFQLRYALLESMKRLSRSEAFNVSIETLDDVVFESEGEPTELLQTKHHVNKSADLADASPDLWKTIRIWCEGLLDGSVPEDSAFFLVTTAFAVERSAAYYLKLGDNRDEAKAIERLKATAGSSTNKSNALAYAAFRALNQKQQLALAAAISVLDGIPVIEDLDACLSEVVYCAAPRGYRDYFLQRLEGWWLRRVVRHIQGLDTKPILSEELEQVIAQLREQSKEDNLPIDRDIMAAKLEASGYQDMVFVHQLRLIEVGDKRILHAIRNYYRAFEHRSLWIREKLLFVDDLGFYEDSLVNDWDIRFQQMRDELEDTAMDKEKKQKANELYKWVETGTHQPIRRGVIEPAIARGTYQILADSQKVGWHPEFTERLKLLLDPQETNR